MNRRTLSKKNRRYKRSLSTQQGEAMRAMRLKDGRERKREDRLWTRGRGDETKDMDPKHHFPFQCLRKCSLSRWDSRLDSLSLPTCNGQAAPLEAFNQGAPVPVPWPDASPRWPKGFPPMPTPLAKAPRKQHILAPRQRGFSKASGTNAGLVSNGMLSLVPSLVFDPLKWLSASSSFSSS